MSFPISMSSLPSSSHSANSPLLFSVSAFEQVQDSAGVGVGASVRDREREHRADVDGDERERETEQPDALFDTDDRYVLDTHTDVNISGVGLERYRSDRDRMVFEEGGTTINPEIETWPRVTQKPISKKLPYPLNEPISADGNGLSRIADSSEVEIPAGIAQYLTPIQKEGARQLWNRLKYGYGCILVEYGGIQFAQVICPSIVALSSALLGKRCKLYDDKLEVFQRILVISTPELIPIHVNKWRKWAGFRIGVCCEEFDEGNTQIQIEGDIETISVNDKHQFKDIDVVLTTYRSILSNEYCETFSDPVLSIKYIFCDVAEDELLSVHNPPPKALLARLQASDSVPIIAVVCSTIQNDSMQQLIGIVDNTRPQGGEGGDGGTGVRTRSKYFVEREREPEREGEGDEPESDSHPDPDEVPAHVSHEDGHGMAMGAVKLARVGHALATDVKVKGKGKIGQARPNPITAPGGTTGASAATATPSLSLSSYSKRKTLGMRRRRRSSVSVSKSVNAEVSSGVARVRVTENQSRQTSAGRVTRSGSKSSTSGAGAGGTGSRGRDQMHQADGHGHSTRQTRKRKSTAVDGDGDGDGEKEHEHEQMYERVTRSRSHVHAQKHSEPVSGAETKPDDEHVHDGSNSISMSF